MPAPRIATHWIPKNTKSASAAVVFRSAVGEPPKGRFICLNGKSPNWLSDPDEDEDADEHRHEPFALTSQRADSKIG